MEKILPDSKGVYNVSKVKFKQLLKNSNLKLTNNKRSLKKLGYDIKGIFSFSQGKKI